MLIPHLRFSSAQTPMRATIQLILNSQPTISQRHTVAVRRIRRRSSGAAIPRLHSTSNALTCRQRTFVSEYVRGLNGSQAAIRAGCKASNARLAASRLLRKVNVQREIEKLIREREERLNVSANNILQELAAVAFFDPRQLFDEHGNLKPIHTLDKRTAKAISAFSCVNLYKGRGEKRHCVGQRWKFRFGDRSRALELLGKYLGLF
ncbi:MAG: terminase small subunit [Terriglobia bacterium]